MSNTCSQCGKPAALAQGTYRDETCACGAIVLSDAQQALQQRPPRCGTCDCVMTMAGPDPSGNAVFACPWCNPPAKTKAQNVPVVGSQDQPGVAQKIFAAIFVGLFVALKVYEVLQ